MEPLLTYRGGVIMPLLFLGRAGTHHLMRQIKITQKYTHQSLIQCRMDKPCDLNNITIFHNHIELSCDQLSILTFHNNTSQHYIHLLNFVHHEIL